MHIVIAAAEVVPFSKTGGLADVCGALPKELVALGHDVTVVTPYHRVVDNWFERQGVVPEVFEERTIAWANWKAPARFVRTTLPDTDVPVIFIANELFDRPSIYASFGRHDDDLERFTFFSRAVVAACEALGKDVDILHVHDWHTGPLPAYLESGLRQVPIFRNTASVFTIHNLNYQGRYKADRYRFLGLDSNFWNAFEFHDALNMMKGGITCANQVTTVSPGYADEIRTYEGGAGLDGLLRHVSGKLSGILNGIDADSWNPETDDAIAQTFTAGDLEGKQLCKDEVRQELRLPTHAGRPLIGVVSRLVDQKGLDLLVPAIGKLVHEGAQFAILGSGDRHLENEFHRLDGTFPESVSFRSGFHGGLARRITAGSDLILMPSRYEPCGLNQMYALRYGALPIVRFTGGLADSVIPFTGGNIESATGFAFQRADAGDLMGATLAAMRVYHHRTTWKKLQQNAMAVDFSWTVAARQYVEVYERARMRSS